MPPFRCFLICMILIAAPTVGGAEVTQTRYPAGGVGRISTAESASKWLSHSGQTLIRPAAPTRKTSGTAGAPRSIWVRTEGDLLALELPTGNPFIAPWLGAGFGEIETNSRSIYHIGAGFACHLAPLTRLQLGYSFSTQLGLEDRDSAASDDEERHHFTVGLQQSF